MNPEASHQRGRRIRICLLADDLIGDAGTERQIAETVPRLDPVRFEVHVCCFEGSPRLNDLAGSATTAVFPLRSLYTLNGLRQIWRFRSHVSRHRFDVIHAFTVKSAIFGVLGAAGSARRAIVTSRLNTGYWYTPFYIRVFRLFNLFTTSIFANSKGAKDIAIAVEGLPESKVAVIYNGVDTRRYASMSGDPAVPTSIGIPPDVPVVGMVANLRPVKDVALFLRAAALVTQRVRDVAFVIVGQGPLRAELGHLASELGIGGMVFFSDGRGAVPDYLGRMCVGCLSSKSEGLSNAILEYMAAGLPVVATDVGGNPEAVMEGVTGYLVHEHTPEAFAGPIIELLECEERRVAMGRRGLERCHEHFRLEVYMTRLQEYYTGLVRKAGQLP